MKRVWQGVALGALLYGAPASASPSARSVDAVFSLLGLELRGVAGSAPSFGTGLLVGGDVRLVLQGSRFGLTAGARIAAAGSVASELARWQPPSVAQMVVFDLGARMFLEGDRLDGIFVAAGGTGGALYIDRFAFAYGTVWGAYAEAGFELPRHGLLRATGALRLDLGIASATAFSRIPPEPTFVAVSVQVGMFLGGEGTGRARR